MKVVTVGVPSISTTIVNYYGLPPITIALVPTRHVYMYYWVSGSLLIVSTVVVYTVA